MVEAGDSLLRECGAHLPALHKPSLPGPSFNKHTQGGVLGGVGGALAVCGATYLYLR